VANEVPNLFSTMVKLALEGKFSEARILHEELLPLMNLNFIESNPIPVKSALAMMGFTEETCRLPLTQMSTEHRFAMRRVLEELHLVEAHA
ncbi:MAG: dihydrodipicolinate synthase family protein, partial [Bacteroidota bacterium]|nr:dihydrodipicolinate synthase family protein [Bacteroidota bacterium]